MSEMKRMRVLSSEHVNGYPGVYEFHVCRDEDGDEFRLDLMVSGELCGIKPEDIVGKTIEFDRSHPYISIAHGVRIVDSEV